MYSSKSYKPVSNAPTPRSGGENPPTKVFQNLEWSLGTFKSFHHNSSVCVNIFFFESRFMRIPPSHQPVAQPPIPQIHQPSVPQTHLPNLQPDIPPSPQPIVQHTHQEITLPNIPPNHQPMVQPSHQQIIQPFILHIHQLVILPNIPVIHQHTTQPRVQQIHHQTAHLPPPLSIPPSHLLQAQPTPLPYLHPPPPVNLLLSHPQRDQALSRLRALVPAQAHHRHL